MLTKRVFLAVGAILLDHKGKMDEDSRRALVESFGDYFQAENDRFRLDYFRSSCQLELRPESVVQATVPVAKPKKARKKKATATAEKAVAA